MNSDNDNRIVDTLREIRDGQREIIDLLRSQRTLSEEQLARTQRRFDESVELQKEALKRQSTVTRFAVPGIAACIAAIMWLIWKYF